LNPVNAVPVIISHGNTISSMVFQQSWRFIYQKEYSDESIVKLVSFLHQAFGDCPLKALIKIAETCAGLEKIPPIHTLTPA
jgi:hypothetical protein